MTSGIKPTTYQVQVKVFEAAGCRYVRTQGDHLIYRFPGAKRPVVILGRLRASQRRGGGGTRGERKLTTEDSERGKGCKK